MSKNAQEEEIFKNKSEMQSVALTYDSFNLLKKNEIMYG
jgi:hypothetical protein